MSTHYRPEYDITNYQATIIIDDYDIFEDSTETTKYLDLLDSRIYRLINRLQSYTLYQWTDADKIEGVAYRAYGSTTLWWVLMIYNGFVHPLEIEAGSTVKIPSYSELISTIRANRVRIPRTITI